jgi:hypothetical protein
MKGWTLANPEALASIKLIPTDYTWNRMVMINLPCLSGAGLLGIDHAAIQPS